MSATPLSPTTPHWFKPALRTLLALGLLVVATVAGLQAALSLMNAAASAPHPAQAKTFAPAPPAQVVAAAR